jgi:hypothetical protein
MNLSKLTQKAIELAALGSLCAGALTACGPKAADFSILAASQGLFQGATANTKVDVLWVIDNSGSMLTKQQTLANSFGSFANVFVNKGFDFHMAIMTTDIRDVASGGQAGIFQGVPQVFTSATPAFVNIFKSNVVVGDLGDSHAKELDGIQLALSSTLLNGANSGFLRNDAFLSVVMVSDSDDDDSTATPAQVQTFLSSLKPKVYDAVNKTWKDNFMVSAVIADPSDTNINADCAAFAPFEPGTKLANLVSLTSGNVAMICSNDFSSGLTNLSENIVEAVTEVPLSQVPNLSTMVVSENGSLVPQDATNGWTYVSTGNKLVFHGSWIPVANTSISINYIPNDIIR